MLKLNIIGAGHVGQTVGKLWHDSGEVTIQDICNSTVESAQSAINFIGAGSPVTLDTFALGLLQRAKLSLAQSQPIQAEIVMLSVPDKALPLIVQSLKMALIKIEPNFNLNRLPIIFFHTSGTLSSAVLNELGEHCASVHPIHSFAIKENSLKTFRGTYCGFDCINLEEEGASTSPILSSTPLSSTTSISSSTQSTLTKLFSLLGANLVTIKPEQKLLYHAGAVFSCNYLSTLMDLSLRCYELAGIDRVDALKIIAPIATQTLQNILQSGPLAALSGNIARGEVELVGRQYLAIQSSDSDLAKAYAELGKSTVKMLQNKSMDSDKNLSQIFKTLS